MTCYECGAEYAILYAHEYTTAKGLHYIGMICKTCKNKFEASE